MAVVFYTDSSVTYAEGAYVDNALVRKCTSGTCTSQGMEEISPASQLIDVPFATTRDDPDKAPTYEGRPLKPASN